MADVRDRIRWVKEDLANRVDELCGKKNLVVLYTHNLEHEKSKLNKRREEEQISKSRDRENLEEEWKTKLEEEKWEHDLELKQLKEEVRSGNQIRESLEQKIKIKEISGAKEGRIVGKVKTVLEIRVQGK